MTQFRTHSREVGEFAIAREVKDLKDLFEEHAGILEHDAGLLRAELEATRRAATGRAYAGTEGCGGAQPRREGAMVEGKP